MQPGFEAVLRRRTPLFVRKLLVLRHYSLVTKKAALAALRYLLFDRETTNFTYDISNLDELAHFLADTRGVGIEQAQEFVNELETDRDLRAMLGRQLAQRSDRNPVARYGRRTGWYALVRISKPRLVVESGVHDGLGSSILLRALERNEQEGFPGRLIGIDIDPGSGWLIPSELSPRYSLVIGDSLRELNALQKSVFPIDLFIHDSDHRYQHEYAEYQMVVHALSESAVVLSDNAHAESALRDFSAQRLRAFAFWQEQPSGHFYPGAGIGLSFPSAR